MSNNNPIFKIGQEVLFTIGLYQKWIDIKTIVYSNKLKSDKKKYAWGHLGVK